MTDHDTLHVCTDDPLEWASNPREWPRRLTIADTSTGAQATYVRLPRAVDDLTRDSEAGDELALELYQHI